MDHETVEREEKETKIKTKQQLNMAIVKFIKGCRTLM